MLCSRNRLSRIACRALPVATISVARSSTAGSTQCGYCVHGFHLLPMDDDRPNASRQPRSVGFGPAWALGRCHPTLESFAHRTLESFAHRPLQSRGPTRCARVTLTGCTVELLAQVELSTLRCRSGIGGSDMEPMLHESKNGDSSPTAVENRPVYRDESSNRAFFLRSAPESRLKDRPGRLLSRAGPPSSALAWAENLS